MMRFTAMTNEEKKNLKKNTFQFLFGAVLLGCSFIYLQNHKAEASSLWSGFNTLFEKVSITREKIVNKNDTDLLEKKFKLKRYLEDIINVVEQRNCLKPSEIKSIKTIYTNLSNTSNNKLKGVLDDYFQQMYVIDTLVKESCK